LICDTTYIPRAPGVYFFFDQRGRILYIGKAKSLRERVRTYQRVSADTAPNIAALAPKIREVRWQLCASERLALRWESDLLRAIRPPFNIAGTDVGNYLFIELGSAGRGAAREARLSFHLTDEPGEEPGLRAFGCFRNRRGTKQGYTALLRLIHVCRFGAGAADASPRFFAYPARITRDSPPWRYSTPFPGGWVEKLEAFLDGRSLSLLRTMAESLLENEAVPKFLYPSIQDDFETVRTFYEQGPRASRRLKRKHAVDVPVLSQALMDDLITREVSHTGYSGAMPWDRWAKTATSAELEASGT
jgi:hypothetical protein